MGSFLNTVAVACLLMGGTFHPRAQTVVERDDFYLPPGTAIPIQWTHTLKASEARPGQGVDAVLLQEVEVNGTSVLLKGTHVVLHVVEARGLAHGRPSVLALEFDGIETRGSVVHVHVALRALADTIPVRDAGVPQFGDQDRIGRVNLIGGGGFALNDPKVTGADAKVLGYHLGNDVYAKLGTGTAGWLQCRPTRGEQSLAVFAPDACGLYGFYEVDLDNMPGATIALESSAHEMRLYAEGAALLEVVE
jgi:hypothetical protein